MKKYSLCMLLLVAGIHTVNAQTSPGNQNLGLNLEYNTLKNERIFDNYSTTDKVKVYTAGINYSYFIANNVDIAVDAGYGRTNKDVTYNPEYGNAELEKQRNYVFDTHIYLRKYFLFKDKIGFRTGPYIGYSREGTSYAHVVSTKNYVNSYSGGMRLDFVYYPVKNIGLAATVGNIGYYSSNGGGDRRYNSKGVDFTFMNTLGLSFYYVLGK